MKKNKKISQITTMNADQIAANLKKGVGEVRALRIAEGLAKTMSTIGPQDVNTEIFPNAELRKNERVWTQVRNILRKGGVGQNTRQRLNKNQK